MKTAYFWIIFLVAIGVVISFYLIPSGEELALIHLKSQKFSEAENFYLNQYEKGVRTPTIVYELSVLYENKGDLDKAIHIIEEYAKAHPEDTDVLKRLADLYYLNSQYKEYAQTLIQMNHQKAKMEPDTLRELEDYYKEQRDIKQEESILNEIIKSGKGDQDDYAELAMLYFQGKQFEKAASILKTRRIYFEDKNTIDMILFELRVDTHLGKEQSENAVRMVADYLKKKNDPKITSYVLMLFKEQYPDLALQLIDLLQPNIEHNPSLEKDVLLILWDHPDQKEKIHQKVMKLEKYAKKSSALQNFIFEVYLDRNDDENLLRLIRNTPPQQIEERRIVDLSILSAINDKPALAKEMQQALGPEYLKDHPLRALALAIGAKQNDARNRLNDYLKTHAMTRTDLFFLFQLAAAAKFEKEALEIGKKLPPYIGMQEMELLEIAQDYAGMKKADVLYPMIVTSLPTIGNKNGEAALALLDIALHRPEVAVDWLQRQQKIKENTLKVFFEVAKEYKEYALDLYIAERLVKEYPSLSSESSYGLALVQAGKIENGIAVLKQLYTKHPLSPQIQKDYLAALVLAVKQNKQYVQDLKIVMNDRERQGHLSKNTVRDFGYIYLETLRDYPKAKRNFFTLANESPANSDDVQTLIYLWGPRVSEVDAQWIEKHAELASNDDLAYWLENLNFIGRYRCTIHLFQKHVGSLLCARAYFAYMQALSEEKCKDELRRTIDILFPMIVDRKQLEDLSAYAELAEYPEARVWVWQRIVAEFPEDSSAWQALGRALFDLRAYCMARVALEMFFYLDQGSNLKFYESLYEYAEVLRKHRHFPLSRRYYVFALIEIAAAEERTPLMKEIAAQCYYQLSMNREGLCMMREYFEMTGKDADAAAAYANMLMDNGRLRSTEYLIDSLFGR